MHNFHGISSIGGYFFASPVDVRAVSGSSLKEGLCHQCNRWIPIQGDKPVNVEEIYWFKHAQKCHKFDAVSQTAAAHERLAGGGASSCRGGVSAMMEVDDVDEEEDYDDEDDVLTDE
jgi:hypothetical protein